MKKFIAFLAFLFSGLLANAAPGWISVAENVEFTYAFKAEPAKLKDGYVQALIGVTGKKKKETVYYLLRIPRSACDSGFGNMSFLTLDGYFAFSGQFAGGDTIGDHLASALCSTVPYLQAPAN